MMEVLSSELDHRLPPDWSATHGTGHPRVASQQSPRTQQHGTVASLSVVLRTGSQAQFFFMFFL